MAKQHNHRYCPSCKSEDAKAVGEKNGFKLFVCHKCETLFTDRIPEFAEAENYDEYYSDENLETPQFIYKRLEELFSDFSEYRQTDRWLDIGFGAGTILNVAKNLKWNIVGLEVSKPAVEKAREMGFDVFHGTLEDAKYPDNYFDIITASEIIEHLNNPQPFLNEIVRILRPGGLFWATTPSAKGLSYRLLSVNWTTVSPPEHIQLFSKKAIARMLQKAGFSNMQLQTHGTNPVEIINHYRSSPNGNYNSQNRVKSAYQLNESMERSSFKKKIKNILNHTLNLAEMGDSIKIRAEK